MKHPFYIGQKIVYITGLNMDKNSIHSVAWIGNGVLRIKGSNYIWESESFRPISEAKFERVSYSKILEEVIIGVN